jgi:large subunit ribosomal protein L6
VSKIGNRAIALPGGVTLTEVAEGYGVKGPKGQLTVVAQTGVKATVKDGRIVVERTNDELQSRANHGLLRALLNNAVTGVTTPYKKELELVGVGYRAKLAGKNLEFTLGYSHPVVYPLPEGVTAAVPETTQIVLTSIDRQQVGQVAAQIRSLRPPEPYKGKGVLYKGEKIRRKAGKSGGK